MNEEFYGNTDQRQYHSNSKKHLMNRVEIELNDQVGNQVWDEVCALVRDQVWDQVWGQVSSQVWNQVYGQVQGAFREAS